MSDISWAGVGAAIGAFLTGLFAWLVQRNKGVTDIEVAVLSEWQKLNGALSDRLGAVEREFAAYRTKMASEIEVLRTKHGTEIEEMRRQHRTEMKSLRDLNEGLQRQIAQNSHSTAQMLSGSPVTRPKDDQG